MRKYIKPILSVLLVNCVVACSNAPKLASDPMPQSGFLPNYALLQPVNISHADTRVWRYRKLGVNPASYTAIILDPIYLNQSATKEITPEAISQAQIALQESMVAAVNARGNIKIVNNPGPGVARFTVGITGAESSNDSLQPWSFTPIGLAVSAATYAGGVNSKTPALLVESKITDSQSKELLGEGLVTVQGESFRTASGSVDSFIEMAKKVVRVAMEVSANASPTAK